MMDAVTEVGAVDTSDSWLSSMNGKAPSTLRNHRSGVRQFEKWLVAHDRPRGTAGDLVAVTGSDVEAWLADLRAAGRDAFAVRIHQGTLRSFYGWALEERAIGTNPMARIKSARDQASWRALLSRGDLAALFGACAGGEFEDRRDAAVIRLMATSALGVAETLELQVGDVDVVDRVVSVRLGFHGGTRFAGFDPNTRPSYRRQPDQLKMPVEVAALNNR
jgi:integrase/recombinase XerD